MELPVADLVLFVGPVVVYFVVRRFRGEPRREIVERLGVRGAAGRYWAASLGLLLITSLLGWLAVLLIPTAVLNDPRVTVSAYAGTSLSTSGAVLLVVAEGLSAATEELFFRGLLCGVLFPRLGLVWGNVIQTGVFVLPHLALLAVSVELLPIVILQVLISLVIGWLRFVSGSMWPGTLPHLGANVASALTFVVAAG